MRELQMKVRPVNCQVALFVPDADEADEPPEWDTGRELVVANSNTIYVATICDMEGEVDIEVWIGEGPPQLHQEPLYDGTLLVRDAGLLVGSAMGNHLGWVQLVREGSHHVRVYTDPPGSRYATRVWFVFD